MGDSNIKPAHKALPPAAWMGGKRILAGAISEAISAIPHGIYAEPFLGMGGVFFRREIAARCEVVNDINLDLVTLFRVLQYHYEAFIDMLRWQVCGRDEFERLATQPSSCLTDMQRAARFLYLQRTSFGGKVTKQSFGVVYDGPSRFDFYKVEPMLHDIHQRLSDVIIERMPWAEFLTRYDRPETLFYLDPPYYGNEGDYGNGIFGPEQFEIMADRLSKLQGKFILSINDKPEVRKIFAAFPMVPVTCTYTIGGGAAAKQFGELLIGAVTMHEDKAPKFI